MFVKVSSLKDTIARRDEEIERLQLLKDLKNVYPSVISDKQHTLYIGYKHKFLATKVSIYVNRYDSLP